MSLSYFDVASDNLKEVLVAVENIFREDIDDFKKHYHEYVNKNDSAWGIIRYWKYFVVKDENNNIVGVTGLYNESDKHSEGEVWLGWYGVVPEYRGKGIGSEILRWTMQKAKDLGYTKFRLWTTTDEGEKDAQKLYEKVGLKIFDRKMQPSGEYEVLYREVNL